MTPRFPLLLLLAWSLATLPFTGRAQTGKKQPAFYTVQNDVIVLKTGSTYKPLKEEITLPNGNRLLPLSHEVVLANGTQVALSQDDIIMASGDIIRVKKPEPTPATGAAGTSAAGGATFAYAPAPPVEGKLKGVVELGASGFNSFIIRADAQRNWKLEKAEYGNSLVLENMATEDDIRRGLKAYIGKMLDYGVSGRSIYFIVSSGAAEAPVTRHIVQNLKALGYVVHTVTPEQEGDLGLRATLPPSYLDKAFFVDMGSANTKIAWLDHDKVEALNTYGSKYFQADVPEATVVADAAGKAAQVPAGRRGTCFIIGGVPFELAKTMRQGQEPYTVLLPPSGYAQLEGAKAKAGVAIYRALAEATGCQQFVFNWDANFTIGYLLQLP